MPGFPADELFLQYPASGANTVYTIDGAAQTVRARLTRAVCRIAVIVKRGYHDGTRYVEVPYAKPQSVLGQIGRIELSADHTGQRVNPDGSSGTATVTATLAVTHQRNQHHDQCVFQGNPHNFIMKHLYIVAVPGIQESFTAASQLSYILKTIPDIL